MILKVPDAYWEFTWSGLLSLSEHSAYNRFASWENPATIRLYNQRRITTWGFQLDTRREELRTLLTPLG